MNYIEKYYNKFNEDKRLNSRHGIVEYTVASKYIQKYISGRRGLNILDIGAGTGRYSIPLANQGHNVVAVELVKHNLNVIKQKCTNVKALLGDAKNLKKFADNLFDITLVFGPMYHLFNLQDQVAALSEAKRVTKVGGIILVMYISNEYAVIKHGFMDQNILNSIKENTIDGDFKVNHNESNLYYYCRVSDINNLNNICKLKRVQLIGVDGATDYIRPSINKLTEEEFDLYIDYQLSICELPELVGASSHILDILVKE